MALKESCWSTWCFLWVTFFIILTLVVRTLIKLCARTKNKSAIRLNLNFNRCISKDSGFSGDEDSGVMKYCGDEYRGKINKIDLVRRGSITGRAQMKTKRTKDRGHSTSEKKILNGPLGLPIFGSLHLLGGSGGPFYAFTMLSRKYGEIYAIKLGSSKCIVVSSYRLVKEVLVTKGQHFGGRPNFLRFHELFGGDRNNSLALCDWSELQRTRRSLARSYCSPRNGSSQQCDLAKVASVEANRLLKVLDAEDSLPVRRGDAPLKPLILAAVANMFTHYMCSSPFSYEDSEFRRTVRIFDEIFWEINQGYAIDFLPWLSPLYAGHMRRLRTWATEIRSFILKRIINGRRSSLDLVNGIPRDFTDALLLHLESPETEVSWDHIMFELEDFLGGHSAIGNLVMLVLAHVAKCPEIQVGIHAECDAVKNRKKCQIAGLTDRPEMPYTEAVIWETLRVSSSPIVPHVASKDTDVDGYPVEKGTVVFVNNYELNLGDSYWGIRARDFCPARFLTESKEVKGKFTISKPAHFMPFSTGKRTCIGQRLVQGFTFATVAAIFSQYQVLAADNGPDLTERLVPGCIAVPPDTFHLALVPRVENDQVVI
ncbi:cytochrome P450 307a1-like [Athalia rosae]|uniref:cytochrome P450 307a1-like n=1 Tax=Athalia rosae TaxID=37344 RepID=UPI002033791C|nr:cytochrome P450 307a1-like [Athalia rosae]XP_048511882.1 cytochrome P450 307a1-like [Athalia rosae]